MSVLFLCFKRHHKLPQPPELETQIRDSTERCLCRTGSVESLSPCGGALLLRRTLGQPGRPAGPAGLCLSAAFVPQISKPGRARDTAVETPDAVCAALEFLGPGPPAPDGGTAHVRPSSPPVLPGRGGTWGASWGEGYCHQEGWVRVWGVGRSPAPPVNVGSSGPQGGHRKHPGSQVVFSGVHI